jgi:aspartyl-tRNA(Asn)/glutamyl-tRNA(Gln) amidotransferase subunit C
LVSKEELLDIAILSKLEVAEDEIETLTEQMQNIIAFADRINEAEGSDDEFDNINGLSNVFHEDKVVPSYPREEILLNVDGGENGYFPVKKRM